VYPQSIPLQDGTVRSYERWYSSFVQSGPDLFVYRKTLNVGLRIFFSERNMVSNILYLLKKSTSTRDAEYFFPKHFTAVRVYYTGKHQLVPKRFAL
jgi:hypothetical protein